MLAHLTLTVFGLSSRSRYVPQSHVHMLLLSAFLFVLKQQLWPHTELGAGASQEMKQVSFQMQMKKVFD